MINETIKIGLLEYGYRIDKNSMTAIEEIVEYAIEADKLGFTRFWLGEHHGPVTTMAFTNPDLLIGIIAGMTDRIKVGSAGSTILINGSYPVATNYKLLNNMFYDRIDLGLAKGRGLVETNTEVKMDRDFIKNGNFRTNFDHKLRLMYDLFNNEKKNLDENEIVIPPYGGKPPEMWYLSTSYRNVEMAIKYGLSYSRSLFHSLPGDNHYNKEELLKFKQDYFEVHKVYPNVNLGVTICMGDTMADAQKEYDNLLTHYGKGENERFKIFPVTVDVLYDMLLEFQDLYGMDEFIIHDLTDNPNQMLKNIHAISEKFNLQKEVTVN